MASKSFKLSRKDQEAQTGVYADIEYMVEQRNKTWPHFNGEDGDRTLVQYIDDSDKRLNAYTPPRDAQGKEDWQNNFFNPVTRNKMKAIIAGVALQPPELEYRAVNTKGVYSAQRAEAVKNLVKHSRLQGNPQLDIFFEAWECAAKGTVIKYDGYLKTKYKRKFIKSFDVSNGDVEFDEREEIVDDRPVDLLVPLVEFFIWDFHTFDVQDQPKIAWIRHYDKSTLQAEFGQYKNFKFIKDASAIKRFEGEAKSYFLEKWQQRVNEDNDYEVIRYYNKLEDRYEIWCNGVPLLRAPLVWGKARKVYPFAKTIFEPFVGYKFFYGKSFPSVIEGIQGLNNTLLNTILDKMYRSLTPPMLVGLQNKDLFDIEDELVTQDNKVYVPDVNAVKPMPFNGVTTGEIAILELVGRMGDLASVDANQQGLQGRGVTAREIVIADENARKLKGVFFMFLEDLWVQKTRLRVTNILMNYMRPKMEKVVGKDGAEKLVEAFSIFNVPDVELSDGSVGVLGIQVASKDKMLSVPQIEAREEVMKQNGINYKLIAVTSDYLDNWDFDFQVVPASLTNPDKVRKSAELTEKLQLLATIFPEYVAANKARLFKQTVEIYGEHPDEYQEPPPPETPESLLEANQPINDQPSPQQA